MNREDFKQSYTAAVYEFNRTLADKLHITEKELGDIVEGKITVKRIQLQYRESSDSQIHIQVKRSIKSVGIAAMALVLILCLSIPGLADSVRESLLRIFTGQKAVHVESVAYDRYAELQGYVVPSLMPSGYASNYQTTTGDMLYMSYVNGAGEQIQYSCYPRGASASYDNEHAAHHVIESKRGTIHVWNAESGHTTAYLLVGEAYVQMDFDTAVTDREIQQIVDGLNRVS